MCALKRVSTAVPKVTDKTFKRKYIALGKIVTQWREIMGDKLADHAQPLKIHYRKPKRKGDRATAILDIAASSSQASLLVMQKGVLLEKINQIFGEQLVTDIKFVHQPNTASFKPVKKQVLLNEDEKNSLSDLLDGIEDAELKQRLGTFGEAVIKDNKN